MPVADFIKQVLVDDDGTGLVGTPVNKALVQRYEDWLDVLVDFVNALETTVGANNAAAIQKAIIDAAGDLIVGTADNAYGRLAKGNPLDQLRVNAAGTALEWAASAATAAPPFEEGNPDVLIQTLGTSLAGATSVAPANGSQRIIRKMLFVNGSGSSVTVTGERFRPTPASVGADFGGAGFTVPANGFVEWNGVITLKDAAEIMRFAASAGSAVTLIVFYRERLTSGTSAYKTLGGALLTNSYATVYTVPALKTAVVKRISWSSIVGSAQALLMRINGSAVVTPATTTIQIPANGYMEWEGDFLLGAGDYIELQSGSASGANAWIDGGEFG